MENEVKNSANTTKDLVALRFENEKLKAEIKDLKQTLEQLMEQLRLARHKRFGASSEKNAEAEPDISASARHPKRMLKRSS